MTTDDDSATTIKLSATDADVDTLTFRVDTGPAHGTLGVIGAPVLAAIERTALAFTEGDPPTVVTSTITVGDVDSANLTGATVQITGNYVNGQDVLAFANTATITGTLLAHTVSGNRSSISCQTRYIFALQCVLRSVETPHLATPKSCSKCLDIRLRLRAKDSSIR